MNLFKIYLAILAVTTAEGGMNTILPPFLDHARYGVELIGAITALFALLQLASRLPAGALYSGARAKNLLVAFAALFIVSTIGFGFGDQLWLVLSLAALHGFAFGAITTVMFPIAVQAQSSDNSQGSRMGWYTAALSAGYALGSFLSGALADRFGYAVTFFALGLFPTITILFAFTLPKFAETAAMPAARAQSGGGRQLLTALSAASPGLLFATLIAFYINFLDDGFGTFFPLFGLGIGLSLGAIGTLKGIKSATGIFVRVLAGGIFKIIDYRLLNHLLVIGWSLAVFILPWVRGEWIFAALFIFFGLARSLSRVTSATIVAEEKAQDRAGIGLASGIYNMGLDAGALAGPLVAGFVARATDVPTMMRIIPFVMLAIYFGAVVWLRRASKARAPIAALNLTEEAE
ncbi:MAG: MFS transporter [Chloroflexi bacterium]|nr:MFS transporter [Chloroflexota bacterium]